MLKTIVRTSFKDKFTSLYLPPGFCSFFSSHFACPSPLQGQDGHQLTPKAVKMTMRFQDDQQQHVEEQPYSSAQQSSQAP